MPEVKGIIIALALLQIEIVFLLALVVIFVIVGLLFAAVFIRAVGRDPNRPEGREDESNRSESKERGRSDRP
jgi:hypothetical protein